MSERDRGTRTFTPDFFMNNLFPEPLIILLKPFLNKLSQIPEDIRNSMSAPNGVGGKLLKIKFFTVKRPKFGNGPLVRHPLFEVLKNHIFAWSEVSDQVQRGERLYIFF